MIKAVLVAWNFREYIVPALIFVLAVPVLLIVTIASAVNTFPGVPPEMQEAYKDAAQNAPVSGITYAEISTIDAVRYDQDFSTADPYQTAAAFVACHTYIDPITGIGEEICNKRSFDSALTTLGFTSEQRERAEFMLAALHTADSSYTFTPNGPYVWPIPAYEITSDYGPRFDPQTGDYSFHKGVDIGASEGTPVYAAASGEVTFAGWDNVYGYHIRLDHGVYSTVYAHLSSIYVSVGESVSAYDLLGFSGNTGYSTGPHLHFEWWVGSETEDPLIHYTR